MLRTEADKRKSNHLGQIDIVPIRAVIGAEVRCGDVRDLDTAVRHAANAPQRKASAVTLRDALQSYSQLLSAEGKTEQAAALASQLGTARQTAEKP